MSELWGVILLHHAVTCRSLQLNQFAPKVTSLQKKPSSLPQITELGLPADERTRNNLYGVKSRDVTAYHWSRSIGGKKSSLKGCGLYLGYVFIAVHSIDTQDGDLIQWYLRWAPDTLPYLLYKSLLKNSWIGSRSLCRWLNLNLVGTTVPFSTLLYKPELIEVGLWGTITLASLSSPVNTRFYICVMVLLL